MTTPTPDDTLVIPTAQQLARIFEGIDLSRSRYRVDPPLDFSDVPLTSLHLAFVYRTDALRAQRILERHGYVTQLSAKLVLFVKLPGPDPDIEPPDPDSDGDGTSAPGRAVQAEKTVSTKSAVPTSSSSQSEEHSQDA